MIAPVPPSNHTLTIAPSLSKLHTNVETNDAKHIEPAKEKKKKSAPNRIPSKKRKSTKPLMKRTKAQIQREQENAGLSEPFYIENGVDWSLPNFSLQDLVQLHKMWQLPAACHILWLLQEPLKIEISPNLILYEAALLDPVSCTQLDSVFTRLLLRPAERKSRNADTVQSYEWWTQRLSEYYHHLYARWRQLAEKKAAHNGAVVNHITSHASIDEEQTNETKRTELTETENETLSLLESRLGRLSPNCPFRDTLFASLSIEMRCKIFWDLTQALAEEPRFTEYLRQMEDDDLRVERLGKDRAGHSFYYFPQFYKEHRIYRTCGYDGAWDLWAKGSESVDLMRKQVLLLRGRKSREMTAFIAHLKAIAEQAEEEEKVSAKKIEKANRRAILEAMPRKRSARIQVKILERKEEDA